MVTVTRGRIRHGWRAVIRQKFWVFVGLAVFVGVVGDAWLRGWWSWTIPFVAA